MSHRLIDKGLGYIDIHLLMSAILTGAAIWTLDRRLNETIQELRLPNGIGRKA